MGVVSWNLLDVNMIINVMKYYIESLLFFVFVIIYFVLVMGNVLGFFVLMKCKKFLLQIKVLFINMIVFDFFLGSVIGIVYGIQYVYLLLIGGVVICYVIFDILIILLILNIIVFGVDCFFSLKFVLKYQIYIIKE